MGVTDDTGETPLHIAAQIGEAKFCEELLRFETIRAKFCKRTGRQTQLSLWSIAAFEDGDGGNRSTTQVLRNRIQDAEEQENDDNNMEETHEDRQVLDLHNRGCNVQPKSIPNVLR
ncbi:unnamed protein product [Didymodactylos carnosus]|uniref:Uncharacterized protein n=1 Tax=Didymodactylos carnosus TaxID=1234261 RepID=A0A816CVW2_9BILA|nr:unnamed protein product [Didymodactylos carnosus]CAF4518805.1 unnamed protein product [Didymodactylos carnosus]